MAGNIRGVAVKFPDTRGTFSMPDVDVTGDSCGSTGVKKTDTSIMNFLMP